MRTRQRSDLYPPTIANNVSRKGVATPTNTVLAPGTIYFNHTGVGSGSLPLGFKAESISDDIGERGSFKGVIHDITDYQLYPCSVAAFHEYDKTGQVVIYLGNESLWHTFPLIPSIGVDRITPSYERTTQQLVNAAAHGFYSLNKADNLLNVVELKQLKSGLEGAFSTLNNIVRTILRPSTLLKRGWAAKTLKQLNNQFLASSFGYQPLISDLKRTYKGIKTLRRDIQALSRKSVRLTSAQSCSGSLAYSWTGISGYSSSIPSVPDTTFFHPSTDVVVRRVAGVWGRHLRQYNSSGFDALDVTLAKYGGTGPVSLAWELVPFSFVLDWFLDLRPVIDALDNTLTGGSKVIDGVWTSEKWTSNVRFVKHRCISQNRSTLNSTLQDWPQDGSEIGYSNASHYHRSLSDVTPLVTASGRFGKKQKLLSASLFYQSVANLKSRMR
jgi:hypothetical protein